MSDFIVYNDEWIPVNMDIQKEMESYPWSHKRISFDISIGSSKMSLLQKTLEAYRENLANGDAEITLCCDLTLYKGFITEWTIQENHNSELSGLMLVNGIEKLNAIQIAKLKLGGLV